MENFRLKCLTCGNENQDNFQTTIESTDGYSEYTILNDGYFEVKCKVCGKYGSTDYDVKTPISDLFIVTCAKCESTDWSFISDELTDDEDDYTHLICNKCKNEECAE